MADFIEWPRLLAPAECRPNPVPFSRGGRTLGGLKPSVRTDLGYWSIELRNIPVSSREQRQTWQAIRRYLGGTSGLVAVPAWSKDTAPYVSGRFEPQLDTSHDDDSLFDDGTPYLQGAISVVSDGITPIGATQINLRIINADSNLVGVRFSYQHALYETGPAIDISGDVWTVSISPTVRATIPAGSDLEFDFPTCLCHLDDDRGMDGGLDTAQFEQRSVTFVEATDYWSSLVS